MELSLKSLVLVVSLAATVAANSTFVQPPNHGPGNNYQDNPVYKEGQKVDLQWQSDLDIMDLIIFQVYPSAGKGNEFFYKVKRKSACCHFAHIMETLYLPRFHSHLLTLRLII